MYNKVIIKCDVYLMLISFVGLHLLREVNLDKVREWKPFYKFGKQRALGFNFPLDKKAGDKVKLNSFSQLNETHMVNVGYEVYADGLTRVLRICERNESRKLDKDFHPGAKITVRISRFSISLCDRAKQVSLLVYYLLLKTCRSCP